MRTAILTTLVCFAAPFSVACSAAEGDRLETNGDDVAVAEQALLAPPVTIRFDSGGPDRAAVVAIDATGGVLIGGSIPHPQLNSFGVAKFDAQGQLVWRSNPVFGGTTGLVTAIAVRDDLNIYVAGDIVTSSGTETVVVGMRDGGFPLWETRLPKNGFATRIEFFPPFDDVVVMNNELTALSAFNGAVFARLPQGPNNAPFVGVDLVRDRQGRIIVTGNSQGSVVTNKYDFQFGNGRLFSHTFTQTSPLMVRDLAVDSTGNIYFTGTTAPTAGQFGTPFAVKLDTNGVLRSSRSDVGGASVAVDATDNVVFGTDSRVTAPSSVRVTKFNAAGAQVWSTALPNGAGAERSVISSRTGEVFVNHRFDTTQLDAAGNVTGQHTNSRYFANDMKLDAFNNLFLSLDTLTFGPGVAGTGDNDLVALKFASGITTPPPPPPPPPPPAPPAAPSNLTASGGRRIITLTWADRSFDETRFEIYRCPGSTCNPTSYVGISGNTTSFTDAVGRNQTFRYKVRACNDFNGLCSAFSNTATGRSARF